MARHTITVKELQDYLSQETWERAAGSWGTGTNKRLDVNSVTGIFRVTDRDEVTYQGAAITAAVEAYNAAP